jgi:hypothetical protein
MGLKSASNFAFLTPLLIKKKYCVKNTQQRRNTLDKCALDLNLTSTSALAFSIVSKKDPGHSTLMYICIFSDSNSSLPDHVNFRGSQQQEGTAGNQ